MASWGRQQRGECFQSSEESQTMEINISDSDFYNAAGNYQNSSLELNTGSLFFFSFFSSDFHLQLHCVLLLKTKYCL